MSVPVPQHYHIWKYLGGGDGNGLVFAFDLFEQYLQRASHYLHALIAGASSAHLFEQHDAHAPHDHLSRGHVQIRVVQHAQDHIRQEISKIRCRHVALRRKIGQIDAVVVQRVRNERVEHGDAVPLNVGRD